MPKGNPYGLSCNRGPNENGADLPEPSKASTKVERTESYRLANGARFEFSGKQMVAMSMAEDVDRKPTKTVRSNKSATQGCEQSLAA